MLKTFEELNKNFRLKPKAYSIDNLIFKLHYRFTTLALLVATTLVTSQQYIGEHIRCISEKKTVPEKVMNTFCFFTSTFTVVKHYDEDAIVNRGVAHPGVGPLASDDKDEIIRHAYYQWVPFVLFGQAIFFYLTHLIWKYKEKHTLQKLIEGFEWAAFATEKELTIGKAKTPTSKAIEQNVGILSRVFLQRPDLHKRWCFWLITCEFLNVLNVVLQFYFTDLFLQNQFMHLGKDVVEQGYESATNVLDIVFPKVTKCTFHKYGPSGGIQNIDSLCVMALNVINEKIYVFLWFWFIILFCLSSLAVLWRLLSFILHSRSNAFNRFVFGMHSPGLIQPWKVATVTRTSHYADWMFLNYLGGNMDRRVFQKFFTGLAQQLDDTAQRYITNSSGGSGTSSIMDDTLDIKMKRKMKMESKHSDEVDNLINV